MTVVVGYTPTEPGRAALDRAIDEATLRQMRLVVLNSTPGDRYADTGFASREDLAEVRSRLSEAGLDFEVRQEIRGLDAASDIVAVAEQERAELIVLGLRQRTVVGKFLLGSTAQRVLLDAPCAVLSIAASLVRPTTSSSERP